MRTEYNAHAAAAELSHVQRHRVRNGTGPAATIPVLDSRHSQRQTPALPVVGIARPFPPSRQGARTEKVSRSRFAAMEGAAGWVTGRSIWRAGGTKTIGRRCG